MSLPEPKYRPAEVRIVRAMLGYYLVPDTGSPIHTEGEGWALTRRGARRRAARMVRRMLAAREPEQTLEVVR